MLNLNERGLTSHVVHLWRVGNSVSDLDVVADVAFPDGADFGGVWRDGAGPFDLARTLDLPLIAVTDGKTRAIVRSEIGMFASPDSINSSTVGALRHRLGSPTGFGQTRMLSIAGEQFERWQVGDVTVAEFDAVICPPKRARSPAR